MDARQVEALFLYYITDRLQLGDKEPVRREHLLKQIQLAVEAGVDFIQLREKDLSVRELESLVTDAMKIVRASSQPRHTCLLVNSRTDVAIACGTDGVHLRAHDLPASEARAILTKGGMVRPVVAASCHTLAEVAGAEAHGADFAVYGPVFGNEAALSGVGLEQLKVACNRRAAAKPKMPLLALGGVTVENAAHCMKAGAAGVAGIRLFQTHDVTQVVHRLRACVAIDSMDAREARKSNQSLQRSKLR